MSEPTTTLTPLKPKILVVEDQPEVLETMLYLLKRAGGEATGAQTGAKGMQLAKEGKFDLITLDIDLPDTNGLELCRRLKRIFICATSRSFLFPDVCATATGSIALSLAPPIISSNRLMPLNLSPASFPTSKPPDG